MTEQNKPQLHQSHLQTLYRCGYKFKRTVLDGDKEPPRITLVVGSATHATCAKNLQNKIDRGTLLTREAVQDLAHDSFIEEWGRAPIILTPDEIDIGLQKSKGIAQDQTIQMATEYHYVTAPKIIPASVERSWVLEAKGYPFDMAGTWDVDEDFELNGQRFVRIRDTKTRKINLGQREVDTSEQYTFYALAKFLLDGKLPDEVWQDNLIKPAGERPAKAISYRSVRTKDDFLVVYRRFANACDIIEKGAFTPANPSDWWCSKEFCGFAADGSCPFFNSKRSVNYKKTGGRKDDTRTTKSGEELAAELTTKLRECS